VPEHGSRSGTTQLLIAAAAAAVLGHLYALYRPEGPRQWSWVPQLDKVEHLLGFALPVCLVLLAGLANASRTAMPRTSRVWWRVTGVFAAHAVVSELVQHFLYARRSGDPLDVLADWTGVALGWGAARVLTGRRSGVVSAGPHASARTP
jgi:hypothetical protein